MPEINMSITDGKAFFAHETSINFTAAQIIFDFKSISPRIDPRAKSGPAFVLEHNVVMLDPFHAKQIHRILGEALKRYETEFVPIKKSKAIEKAEKKRKMPKQPSTAKADIPTYLG